MARGGSRWLGMYLTVHVTVVIPFFRNRPPHSSRRTNKAWDEEFPLPVKNTGKKSSCRRCAPRVPPPSASLRSPCYRGHPPLSEKTSSASRARGQSFTRSGSGRRKEKGAVERSSMQLLRVADVQYHGTVNRGH
eukprot:5724392-Prymnesium_polylepis.1